MRPPGCVCWLLVATGAAGAQSERGGSVEKFVKQVFIHGVPYTEARQWNTEEDTRKLIQMLEPESEAAYWPQVVAVLGIVGDDHGFCPLIEFLGRSLRLPEGEEASLTVPLALGYLVNAKHSSVEGLKSAAAEASLSILLEGVDPEFWGRPWPADLVERCGSAGPEFTGTDQRAQRLRSTLARRSLLGLALTGRPEAIVKLRALAGAVKKDAAAKELFSDLFPEMLKTARLVSRVGLAKYYDE
jgi:hypothetical protein